jgi:hypothetical protein
MNDRWLFALTLGAVWGVVWAVCLQFTAWGHWLAMRRTWLTVVIGVGGDLLILLLIVPFETWLIAATVIAVSAIGIIVRSLVNEHFEDVH